MKIPFVDLHAQYLTISRKSAQAIADVIRQSAYIRGSNVDGFEAAFAQTIGIKRCVSCANGTDALYLAMAGLKRESPATRSSLPRTRGYPPRR